MSWATLRDQLQTWQLCTVTIATFDRRTYSGEIRYVGDDHVRLVNEHTYTTTVPAQRHTTTTVIALSMIVTVVRLERQAVEHS